MVRKFFALLAAVSVTCIMGCSNSNESIQNTPDIEPTPAIAEVQQTPEAGIDTKAAENDSNSAKNEVVTIKVTSETLTADGKWLTVINSLYACPEGSNLSPQLTWEPVEGAACYAIYMVDNSAGYWLHWRAKNVKETSLPLGAELEESNYKGPYPPGGTHEYEVIVYALKTPPEKYPGAFDSNFVAIGTIEQKLDTVGGVPGNIIGKGSVKGTVTYGEVVE